MEPTPTASPRLSRSSSTSSTSSANKLGLSLDTAAPPLIQPATPTNTLLLTNLDNLDVFRPDNLLTIRTLIEDMAPVHAFAPLKSFRRIVVSFWDEEAAARVRPAFDGKDFMGDRCKVYFGQPTPIESRDEHLALPDAGKLFFISPPPSPPHGWEMRLEDAPNKQVHADDLAEALAKLHGHHRPALADSPVSPNGEQAPAGTRSRSSTLIYRPSDHGDSPALPAVVVEDMTDEPLAMSPIDASRPILAHTMRPPVELMMDC